MNIMLPFLNDSVSDSAQGYESIPGDFATRVKQTRSFACLVIDC